MSGYRPGTATASHTPAPPGFRPGYARVAESATGDALPVTAIPADATPVTAIPTDGRGWRWPDNEPYWPPPPPPPAPRRRMLRGFLIAAALVIVAPLTGLAALVAILQSRPLPQASQTSGTAPAVGAAPGATGPTLRMGGQPDPAAIMAAVQPAVVDVNATLGFRNAESAGTGVVLDSGGLILTNNHVIAGATAISVTEVRNGRRFRATVVGYDRTRDIAVLRLPDAAGLRQIAIGDSAKVAPGDPVVAIGNAGGTGGTPTTVAGTVTGLNRSITATDADGGAVERLTGLIEVNADIQPGDSGGPLVDRTGRLIGINTATSVSPDAQAAGGQGFAIPINTAMTIARQIESGRQSATLHLGDTALLGVQTAQQGGNGNGNGNGAPVTGVLNGSPAQQIGLTGGDVIVAVDGQGVDSPTALTTIVDSHQPGDQIQVQWIDGFGRQRTATVALATGPAG